jgi:CheY-like chemotaxis protein
LEAIGMLTGGLAHDFNNLLTGISGNVSLALMEMSQSDPLYEVFKEIQAMIMRSAALTRQLLTFSRRQINEPHVININDLLDNLKKMLGRLLGEDIALAMFLDDDLGNCFADPGQLEQVIVNLAVNARDAMPSGGKLAVETHNVDLDEEYCRSRLGTKAGPHVMLAVADQGIGMAPELQERIFEPFFTTKAKDKGTGLGLATVYGIVKQHQGSIGVYSEPNKGTVFKIYLPRVEDEVEETAINRAVSEWPSGVETILVVEDEQIVREMVVKLLKRLGYNVLEAQNGGEALMLSEKHTAPIHLLLTDVVMPGLSGREVAERLNLIHPEMKVLFTSGYTGNIIVDHGVLRKELSFIGKPYSPEALAKKIREVLERKN